MEIKAKLVKPYTEIERENFIVEQNHNLGYEIIETETALEALGNTAEELQEIKKENTKFQIEKQLLLLKVVWMMNVLKLEMI